jgi:hypothetical protein
VPFTVRHTPPVGIGFPVVALTVIVTFNCCVVVMLVGFGVAVIVGVVFVGAAPVPLNITVCGELLALLSITFKVAVRVPVALGVNVTWIEQPPPPLTPDWQLFVWLKSPVLVPVKVNVGGFRAAAPVFDSTTVSAVLDVPTA